MSIYQIFVAVDDFSLLNLVDFVIYFILLLHNLYMNKTCNLFSGGNENKSFFFRKIEYPIECKIQCNSLLCCSCSHKNYLINILLMMLCEFSDVDWNGFRPFFQNKIKFLNSLFNCVAILIFPLDPTIFCP